MQQSNIILRFLQRESASGIILFLTAVVALVLSNSPFSNLYHAFFYSPLHIQIGELSLSKPFLFWVNEGLMTIFFLLVGLELKREFFQGELSHVSQIILPAVAALGGMIIPALIYFIINYGHDLALRGWAVPVATDIAFALGILSLFGKRVPVAIKIFLMALAIFDDVGAIFIIALFHTHSLSVLSLGLSAFLLLVLFSFNRFHIKNIAPYLMIGLVLWFTVLESGVHATVSGVLLAFFIPIKKVHKLENALHPWVAFLVMPLFAFANAGLSLQGLSFSSFSSSITLGIILGLFLGKQLGVFSFSWILARFKLISLPVGTNWLEIYAVAIICGIGFTMSLFLGTLAFQGNDAFLKEVRLGVLTGSLLSGIVGSVVLHLVLRKRKKKIESR